MMEEPILLFTDGGYVSHGVGMWSQRNYIFPQEKFFPGIFGSTFDSGMGEWVIPTSRPPQVQQEEPIRWLKRH